MSANLLIVESPAKAKTIKKYLGNDFDVLASYGHVRGLVRKSGSVDVDHDFAMKYQLIARNSKHVDAIARAAQNAAHIYLATDPDREGEAISWHILEILKSKNLLADKTIHRVIFHEITQNAVQEAVAHPRSLSTDLVNAQQARSALDYLVGFNLSPLLWRKIRQGLSAGRVQSPALRLICEREIEIRAFTTQEYWSVHLASHKEKQKFTAKLWQLAGQKLAQFDIPNEARQQDILDQLANQTAVVQRVEKKRKMRHPAAPFTTSTMLQESGRKLGLTAERTTRTAQQLYEGIDTGSGPVGLITYMRTDSVVLATEAVTEIRDYIQHTFEKASLPAQPNTYKNKSKNAQEAHEAIRPTSITRTPTQLKAFLTPEQLKLYTMIWKRTLSSQMASAKFDVTTVDIEVGTANLFRATGQVLLFAGFMEVYLEDEDDAADEDDARLPLLEEGEAVPVDALTGEQHFTQPPPRYTEASLIKALEEFGIGRPSTYPSIISTLKTREYVDVDKKRLLPTDTGEVVNRFLTEHFKQYVDYHFTANLEDKLDDISNGRRDWLPVMHEFWTPFHAQVEEKKGLSRAEVTHEALDEACPKCQKPLNIRFGKRGRFIGCSTYPECDYSRNLNLSAAEAEADAAVAPEVIDGRLCPKCDSTLVIKSGQYGKFIGCSAYPKCKFIEPLEKPKDTEVACPVCKKATLIERKSRYGKLFYSCQSYPSCKYAVWNWPIDSPCPRCKWPILTLKTTKRRGEERVCPQKECGFVEGVGGA